MDRRRRRIVHAESPALVTVPSVELLEVGEDWATSTGVFTWDVEDLQSAIASQDDPAVRTPVIKLGHVDPRFDGQPSIGRVLNLRLENNDQTLVGDYVGVPAWLASVLPSAYPRRSIEGEFNAKTRTGNEWPFILTACALLGEAYPAIDTLEDLEQFWGDAEPELVPVADVPAVIASGRFVRAVRVEAGDRMRWRTRVAAGAVAYGNLPLAERDLTWTASAAKLNVREWASSDGSGDKDTIDWGKYQKAFFWVDPDNAESFGGYKLAFADVIDGTLTAVPRGIFGAAGAIQGSRGGVNIPDEDVDDVKATIAKYYAKMADEFDDDSITPPWEGEAAAMGDRSKVRAAVSVDDIRRAYYDTLGPGEYWWWIREVRVNPAELIVDTDDGELLRVTYTIGSDDSIVFGEPVTVKIEYVDVAAAGSPSIDVHRLVAVEKGQAVAARWTDAETAGRPDREGNVTPTPPSATMPGTTQEVDVKLSDDLLAKLGLESGASEEDINKALAERLADDGGDGGTPGTGGETTATPEPTPDPGTQPSGDPTDPGGQPAPAPAPETQPSGEPTGEAEGTPTVPDGQVLVDAGAFKSMTDFMARTEAKAKADEEAGRNRILDDAIQAGKFPRARRAHYEALLKADPEGAKATIDSLAPGLVPVAERGNVGGEVDPTVNAYPDTWKPAVAAQNRGIGQTVKVVND